jgi:hypothetical protein
MEAKVRVLTELSLELAEWLRDEAKRQGVSLVALTRNVLQEYREHTTKGE